MTTTTATAASSSEVRRIILELVGDESLTRPTIEDTPKRIIVRVPPRVRTAKQWERVNSLVTPYAGAVTFLKVNGAELGWNDDEDDEDCDVLCDLVIEKMQGANCILEGKILRGHTKIKSVFLHHVVFQNVSLAAFWEHAEELQVVHSQLYGCDDVAECQCMHTCKWSYSAETSSPWPFLQRITRNTVPLQRLHIQGPDATHVASDVTGQHMAAVLEKLPIVEILQMRRVGIHDGITTALVKIISELKQLKSLDWSENSFSGGKPFTLLREMSTLEELKVLNTQMEANETQRLEHAFHRSSVDVQTQERPMDVVIIDDNGEIEESVNDQAVKDELQALKKELAIMKLEREVLKSALRLAVGDEAPKYVQRAAAAQASGFSSPPRKRPQNSAKNKRSLLHDSNGTPRSVIPGEGGHLFSPSKASKRSDDGSKASSSTKSTSQGNSHGRHSPRRARSPARKKSSKSRSSVKNLNAKGSRPAPLIDVSTLDCTESEPDTPPETPVRTKNSRGRSPVKKVALSGHRPPSFIDIDTLEEEPSKSPKKVSPQKKKKKESPRSAKGQRPTPLLDLKALGISDNDDSALSAQPDPERTTGNHNKTPKQESRRRRTSLPSIRTGGLPLIDPAILLLDCDSPSSSSSRMPDARDFPIPKTNSSSGSNDTVPTTASSNISSPHSARGRPPAATPTTTTTTTGGLWDRLRRPRSRSPPSRRRSSMSH